MLERDSDTQEESGRRRTAIEAARNFARSVAGDDKVKFIHAFQIALGIAESAMGAKPDDFAELVGPSVDLLPKQFCSDTAFVDSMVDFIERDVLVLGGTPADEFPDCVAVGTELNGWGCSGTLIAANAVLTARHCTSSFSKVYVGPNVHSYKETYAVAEAVEYTPYNGKYHNDVGLLFLNENVEKVEGVRPRPRATTEMVDAAQDIVVAGFGSNNPSGFGGNGLRRKAMLRIISYNCSIYDTYQFNCYQGVEMIAIGVGKNSCKGDSGGPAYIQAADNQWYLAGVTSRSIDPAVPCGGHVYVRIDVDPYKKWIDEQLAKHPPTT